jgi:hypothetical protein
LGALARLEGLTEKHRRELKRRVRTISSFGTGALIQIRVSRLEG